MGFLSLSKEARDLAQERKQALLDAVLRADYKAVRVGLEVGDELSPCLLGNVMGFDNPLLSAAVAKGDLRMVEVLLDAGFSIECTGFSSGSERVSPAFEAVEAGALTMLDLLERRGADMSRMRISEGETMLHVAIAAGHAEMAMRLIDPDVSTLDLFAVDADGRTALDLACIHDMPEVHRALWRAGVRGGRVCKFGGSPLTHAASFTQAVNVVTSRLPAPTGAAVPQWVVQALAACRDGDRHPAFLAWQTENAIASLLSSGADDGSPLARYSLVQRCPL
jgi:ankyrin repeat protein